MTRRNTKEHGVHRVDTEINGVNKMMINQKLTGQIIGCAIKVHNFLGPGLLESAYEECLTFEIKKAGLFAERQKTVKVIYEDIVMDFGYRIDILAEKSVVIELKTVDAFNPVHEAQILTYMKFAEIRLGLLMNFNVVRLKDGLKRYVL